jgi:hypothetical protein
MLLAEALIRDRLADIPGVTGVHGMADFSMGGVAGRRFPALFVGAMGYRVQDAQSPGAVKIAMRYVVVVAMRQVTDVIGGTGAREAASDIAAAVMSRLYRWQPSADYQPMLPIEAPRPQYDAGVLMFPLAFETSEIIERSLQ